MKIDKAFGGLERARIEDAVRRAELATRGQVVPVVVEKSDPYPEARYRGALILAALATAVAIALRLPMTIAELPLLQLGAGALGALLSMWDPVERRLIGKRAMDEAARARAVRAFHEEGLQRTAEGTGVLVFASLFEREAVVLGDRGIHERLGSDWSRPLQLLIDGMHRRDPTTGFVEAIDYCGARLAEHFPRGPGNPPKNELSDEIRGREK